MTIRDGPWQAAAEASSLRAISIAESVTEGPIGLKAISDWPFVHKGNNSPASLLWAAGRTMGHGKNSKKRFQDREMHAGPHSGNSRSFGLC